MRIKPAITAVLGAAMLLLLAHPGVARAAEITVLCSNGFRAVMQDLVPQFERATRHTVTVRYGLSTAIARQIEAGETFDLAVLTPSLIDDLIRKGTLAGDTRVVLARSAIALAIREGRPKPDVRTTDALRRTLLASRSIAYAKEGASAAFFLALVQRLGLTQSLQSRIQVAASGEDVGASVARGDAELGVLPVSEILPIRGVDVAGAFPAEVRGYVTMVAGVSARAPQRAAALELIAFLTDPAVLPVITTRGMERETR